MKVLASLLLVILLPVAEGNAQKTYSTSRGHVSFFAEAPVSDVDARNDRVKATINTDTKEVVFEMKMADFEFANAKMGRDARKKYIEIDRYGDAGFRGKITGDIDFGKPGTYRATAAGKLKIHGVEKNISEKGTVTVSGDKVRIRAEFSVALKDYNIETPRILGQAMTAETVLVNIDATLSEQIDAASKK